MRSVHSVLLFILYLSLTSSQLWQPCYLDTTVPGMDIADDASLFPDPFLWFTNDNYPGVTLPGPYMKKKCGWTADGTTPFIWNTSMNTCYLNGQGYPLTGLPHCSNHKFATNSTDFERVATKFMNASVNLAKPVANLDGSTAHVATITVQGTTYQAAMSIGHGMFKGLCGNCFLVRYDGNYVFLLQTDVRAWSLELSGGANSWLANDNYGGTCHIPDVLQIDCDQAIDSMSTSNSIETATTTASTSTVNPTITTTSSSTTTSTTSTNPDVITADCATQNQDTVIVSPAANSTTSTQNTASTSNPTPSTTTTTITNSSTTSTTANPDAISENCATPNQDTVVVSTSTSSTTSTVTPTTSSSTETSTTSSSTTTNSSTSNTVTNNSSNDPNIITANCATASVFVSLNEKEGKVRKLLRNRKQGILAVQEWRRK